MKLYNISHMLIRRLSAGLGVFALLALFCVQPGTALAATTHPAFVRIIHASPDIGIVDAFVDGQKILSNWSSKKYRSSRFTRWFALAKSLMR